MLESRESLATCKSMVNWPRAPFKTAHFPSFRHPLHEGKRDIKSLEWRKCPLLAPWERGHQKKDHLPGLQLSVQTGRPVDTYATVFKDPLSGTVSSAVSSAVAANTAGDGRRQNNSSGTNQASDTFDVPTGMTCSWRACQGGQWRRPGENLHVDHARFVDAGAWHELSRPTRQASLGSVLPAERHAHWPASEHAECELRGRSHRADPAQPRHRLGRRRYAAAAARRGKPQELHAGAPVGRRRARAQLCPSVPVVHHWVAARPGAPQQEQQRRHHGCARPGELSEVRPTV